MALYTFKEKTMIKVTVTHYLNKKLKPTNGVGVYEGNPAFPVYIRISFGRNNQRIRSRWIHFDATEQEFETDKRIQEIKAYEAAIISDIFKYQNDDKFDIGTKFDLYLQDLINHYVGWVVQKDEISDTITDFICAKTGLNKHILPHMGHRDIIEYGSEDWYELVDKNVFSGLIKNKILYLALLNEFKSINYKDNSFDYEVGTILNFHEWKNRGGKELFLQFAEDKQIMNKSVINEITEIFDNALKQKIQENWFILLDMSGRNKPKK